MHFEVYESLDAATSASNKLRTSQLALPEDVCGRSTRTDGYDASVANLDAPSAWTATASSPTATRCRWRR